MTKKQEIRNQRRAQIIWRYTIVSLGILLFAGFIVQSAVRTTVSDADAWNEKANASLSRVDTIQPLRGEILASDGSILATNVNFYDIRIDFAAAKFMEDKFRSNLRALSDTLAKVNGMYSGDEWYRRLKAEIDLPKGKRHRSYLLLKGLTYDESERVRKYPFFNESKNNNRTGFVRERRIKRCYPYGDMARRSIGRVCEKPNGQTRGLSGLEFALDSMLYGRPGVYKKVPLTKNIVNWTDRPAVNGTTLITTIDIAMQDIVETELNAMLDSTQAHWGTCVLMEVGTGDIKAISNLERDSTGRYIEAQNYSLMGFEPGSVMKAISMTIALEDGYAPNINQMYQIGSTYNYAGGPAIHDTHSPAELPVSRFLEYSSNIGMTKLLCPHFQDNPNRFRERVAQTGLLDRFNTGIAGEQIPVFPTLYKDYGWLVSLSRQVYGYTTQIPALYTCAFYNALANDGRFVRPRIVRGIRTQRGDSLLPVSYVRERICSAENAALMRSMLHQVIYGEHGTARMLKDSLVNIAGKTGTSKVANETVRDDKGNIINKGGGYIEGAYRLAFCGFFPYDKPRYTCMVLISQPAPQYRSAGGTSGMVLKAIARRMYSHGMLGDNPSYSSSTRPEATDRPTVYAATAGQNGNVKNMLGVQSVNRIVSPRATKGVPDVSGLGLRQAVAVLEKAGYEVSVHGTGYVASQSPRAGTAARAGTRVSLNLTQNI